LKCKHHSISEELEYNLGSNYTYKAAIKDALLKYGAWWSTDAGK